MASRFPCNPGLCSKFQGENVLENALGEVKLKIYFWFLTQDMRGYLKVRSKRTSEHPLCTFEILFQIRFIEGQT